MGTSIQEMRRSDRAMPQEMAQKLLENGEYGILATTGADGQPYATPLSYCVEGNSLYFHCAKNGQKINNLAHEARVCFCVVGFTEPVYEGKNFSTWYESVVVYGRAALVEDAEKKKKILVKLCEKYLPDYADKAAGAAEDGMAVTAVYEIAIEKITGKAKRK